MHLSFHPIIRFITWHPVHFASTPQTKLPQGLYTIYYVYIVYILVRLFVCILVRIFRLLSHCFHFEINNALSCASCSININQRPFVSSHSTPGQSRGGSVQRELSAVGRAWRGLRSYVRGCGDHFGVGWMGAGQRWLNFSFVALMKVIY